MYLICVDNPKIDETGRLIEAALKNGIEVKSHIKKSFWTKQELFFIYGVRNFVLPIIDDKNHIFSNQEYLYEFSFLMSIFDQELYNSDAILVPAGRVPLHAENSKFIRPNSGNKQFTGYVLDRNSLKDGITYLLHINPWEMVVLASEKPEPQEEYRFFCLNDEIIGCRYHPTNSNVIPEFVLQKAKEFSSIIFDNMTFGNSFVLDISVCDNICKIMELNSWNSSAFYGLDAALLIDAIFK